MTKKNHRYWEDEIDESCDQLDELDLSDEHMAAVRERAFQLYQIHMKIEEVKAIRRKQRLHRVVTTFGVAFAIMVVSFVYIALTPSFVSEANETMTIAIRRVREWMHLDIENHVPYDREGITAVGTFTDFSSIDDYLKYYQYPFAYFDDSQFSSLSIHVESLEGKIEINTVHQQNNDIEISISTSLSQEDNTVYLNNDQNAGMIAWRDIPIYYWQEQDSLTAVCYHHGVMFRINADGIDANWLENHINSLIIIPQEWL